MPLTVVFMGTPEFAVPALQALTQSPHHVVAVYSQPPRPAGRGQKLKASPVQLLAEEHLLPVHTPVNFKSPESLEILRSHQADVAVVAAYGLLLPQAVLDIFPKSCLNIHPSLLPRWRGAAPIHRTILAGDKQTGICIMKMDAGLDTGAVLVREEFELPDNITTGKWHDLASQKAVPLLLQALEQIENGTAESMPQNTEGATYAKKISKDEANIDWSQPAEAVGRLVRGLNPYPVAVTIFNNEPLKIWEAEMLEATGKPGTVLDDRFTIACGNGAIRPTLIQFPGKRPMATEEALRGHPIPAGTVLG